MARIAFHLEIKRDRREEYRTNHENIPEAFERLYLDSGAGLEMYSVFEMDGHVFGFMEVERPEVIQSVIASQGNDGPDSEESILKVPSGDPHRWLDEVYRMR